MARRPIELPTSQYIEQLYDEGNTAELRKINERLAKTANQRMATLLRSRVKHNAALDIAQYYLYQESDFAKGGVFSRSKKLSSDQLLEQINEELKFLRAKGSTVAGEKEIRARKSFKTLTQGKIDEKGNKLAPYLEIPEDIQVPDYWEGSREEYFENRFLDFLEEDAWKDIKKYLYTDNNSDLFRQAGEAIARGQSLKDLRDAYKQYLRGEISVYTMWDSWVSI